MSEIVARRRLRVFAVDIATTTAESSSLWLEHYAAGAVYVSGVTASAVLSFYGSADGSQFLPASGSDGTPDTVTVPATGGAVSLPASVAGLAYGKLVAATPLSTAAAAVVTLKS